MAWLGPCQDTLTGTAVVSVWSMKVFCCCCCCLIGIRQEEGHCRQWHSRCSNQTTDDPEPVVSSNFIIEGHCTILTAMRIPEFSLVTKMRCQIKLLVIWLLIENDPATPFVGRSIVTSLFMLINAVCLRPAK